MSSVLFRAFARSTAGAVLVAAAILATPRAAEACGGFFCSNQPIEQAGEKIVFSVEGNKVTAVIQIQFQGDAKEFSWVLPLPSVPNEDGGMKIGSEELFTQLMWRTRPTFQVQWDPESQCNPWWGNGWGPEASAGGGDFSDDADGEGVQVLQVKDVGPYTASVVKSDDAQALSKWLEVNGYDQPPEADELIAWYVEQKKIFLALKLQQDKGAGDIAPIIVSFEDPQGACIPLVLTSIAATPEMPVYAWILDENRIVPKNFFHVDINYALVNWFDGGQNYLQVVTDAVNEAQGHGFVTDYAGPADIMKQALIWEGRFQGISDLPKIKDPAAFYEKMLMIGLPANSQTQNLIRKYIPAPNDWKGTDQEFYCCLYQHKDYLDTLDFDPVAFAKEIEDVIVQPIEDAQEMLDAHPFMTRLFTTVSPDEMTRDPIFQVEPSLPEVPLMRSAKGKAICTIGEGGQQVIQSVTLTLENGTVIDYAGPFENWTPPGTDAGSIEGKPLSEQPAADLISTYDDESGAWGQIPVDLVPYYDEQILSVVGTTTPAPGDVVQPVGGGGGDPANSPSKKRSGCSSTAAPAAAGALLLVVFAMGLTRLRRRRAE